MNSKRDTLTFGLVVFVLSAIFISRCSQFLEETNENWLTYRNEAHRYTFSYPSNCKIGPMPEHCKESPPKERLEECLCFLNAENPEDVRFEKIIIADGNISIAAFSISHYDTPLYNPPPSADLITWLEENLPRNIIEYYPDEINAEIGGIPAVEIYKPRSPMAFASTFIFFLCDDELFLVHMNDVDNEANMAFYNQILKSIHFENGNM